MASAIFNKDFTLLYSRFKYDFYGYLLIDNLNVDTEDEVIVDAFKLNESNIVHKRCYYYRELFMLKKCVVVKYTSMKHSFDAKKKYDNTVLGGNTVEVLELHHTLARLSRAEELLENDKVERKLPAETYMILLNVKTVSVDELCSRFGPVKSIEFLGSTYESCGNYLVCYERYTSALAAQVALNESELDGLPVFAKTIRERRKVFDDIEESDKKRINYTAATRTTASRKNATATALKSNSAETPKENAAEAFNANFAAAWNANFAAALEENSAKVLEGNLEAVLEESAEAALRANAAAFFDSPDMRKIIFAAAFGLIPTVKSKRYVTILKPRDASGPILAEEYAAYRMDTPGGKASRERRGFGTAQGPLTLQPPQRTWEDVMKNSLVGMPLDRKSLKEMGFDYTELPESMLRAAERLEIVVVERPRTGNSQSDTSDSEDGPDAKETKNAEAAIQSVSAESIVSEGTVSSVNQDPSTSKCEKQEKVPSATKKKQKKKK